MVNRFRFYWNHAVILNAGCRIFPRRKTENRLRTPYSGGNSNHIKPCCTFQKLGIVLCIRFKGKDFSPLPISIHEGLDRVTCICSTVNHPPLVDIIGQVVKICPILCQLYVVCWISLIDFQIRVKSLPRILIGKQFACLCKFSFMFMRKCLILPHLINIVGQIDLGNIGPLQYISQC